MSRRGRGWRPALRIARRQVRRNLGRSLLVAVLVGLPVAGATIADVLYRSAESPDRSAYQRMGDADAVLEITAFDRLPVPPDGTPPIIELTSNELPEPDRDPASVDLAALVPPGTVLVPDRLNYTVRLRDGDTVLRPQLLDIGAQGGPLSDHVYRLDEGRWPERPDEVALTRRLAEQLDLLDGGDLRPDATVRFDGGPELRVSGLLIDPFFLDGEAISAAPGSEAAEFAATALDHGWNDLAYTGGRAYLADLPAGADLTALGVALAADGVGLQTRSAIADPGQYYEGGGSGPTAEEVQQAALTAMVVGLGLLEVVLLAGAAFAVGARRQVREIGLLVAGGASAAQVRRTVLAQGLVLGVLGAALGLAAGAALVPLAAPAWESYLGSLIDDWTFGWAELAIAAGVGVLSGLAAAVVPAIGAARMQPVDALAQRFRTTRLAARLPLLGVVLFVAGAGGALIASRILAGTLDEYGRQLAELAGSGRYLLAPVTAPYIAVQLTGALVATAGLVMLLPGLISALARGAHRLGLSARLALRDAARHRHRTAPTVAAIAIVVAGTTAVAFAAGGSARAEELRYTPSLPDNVLRVEVDRHGQPMDDALAQLAAAEEELTARLPDAVVHRVTEATVPLMNGDQIMHDSAWLQGQGICADCGSATGSVYIAVADPAIMAVAAGHEPSPADLAAVAAGEIVVYDRSYLDDTSTAAVDTFPADDGPPVRIELPGHLAERDLAYTSLPGAFASAQTLEANGFRLVSSVSIVTFGDTTPDQLDAAMLAAEAAGAFPMIEVAPEPEADAAVLALTAGAAFVTLVGVAIAVSLAAAEGRADLATLAAVGAPPRRRRALAGAQALVVAGLGVLIGSGLGVYFAYLVWPALGSPEFIWAWDTLAVTGVAVPVLAVLIAVLFTPSRLPMVRRVE
ncbi:ABC transporter permease [Jiangella anatolica]|uniref:ABC3 transporter permease C-terminal domain-containing protein n=1 Tax=Jiangella anatolica TaxID=2670374 RepID=A0A2W2D1P2_9ACTN|nr:ABC transporter permease [Jiangella anatolica]PZF86433.1 hypothetical protein C1I92_01075 [Jiangella anatolica]